MLQLSTQGLTIRSGFTRKYPELLDNLAPSLLKVDAASNLHLNEEYWQPIDPASAASFTSINTVRKSEAERFGAT